MEVYTAQIPMVCNECQLPIVEGENYLSDSSNRGYGKKIHLRCIKNDSN